MIQLWIHFTRGELPNGLKQSPREFKKIYETCKDNNSNSSHQALSCYLESTRNGFDSCEGEGQGPT